MLMFHSYNKKPEGTSIEPWELYPYSIPRNLVDYGWNPVASGLLYKMINPEQVVQTAIAIKE